MNNKHQSSSLSQSILSVMLVLIESALTLVLRFDPKLRQAAYPLAKQETLVAIRTYLPHTQVYATFSYKGVLLDSELPPHKKTPDVIINAYSFQLFQTLTGHNPKVIDALQIRGDSVQVAWVKDFLLQIGIGSLIQNLIGKIRPNHSTAEQKTNQKEDKLAKLSEQLAQKTEEANVLSIENARLNTELAEIYSKQKTTMTTLIIMSIIAIIAIVMHFI